MAKAALSPSKRGGKRRMSSPPGRSILMHLGAGFRQHQARQRPRQQRGEIENEKAGQRLHGRLRYANGCQLAPTWRGLCIPLNGRPAYLEGPDRMKLPAPVLSAARDRRAGAAARTAGAARAHDPFRAAAHREAARQGARARRARSTWCSAISRTPFRPTPRRRRARASSPWRRRSISARPDCGRASTRSTRPGRSTT